MRTRYTAGVVSAAGGGLGLAVTPRRRAGVAAVGLWAVVTTACGVPFTPPDPCPPPATGFVPNCTRGGKVPAVDARADFRIVLAASSSDDVVLAPGQNAELTVYIEHSPRFAGLVTLEASGPPDLAFSVWPSLLPVPINKAFLYISVPEDTGSGEWTITITGSALVDGQMVRRTKAVSVRVPPPRRSDHQGYAAVDAGGTVHPFRLAYSGSVSGARPAIGIATLRGSRAGYRVLTDDGDVHPFGRAQPLGSMKGRPVRARIVGIASTPTGDGYWLVGADGGVFSFGDATFYGSTGGMQLNQPIIAIEATITGRGYWLLARDGGVFTFGDARFHGSTGDRRLNAPVVDMGASSINGYWLLAADGGVFSFGPAAVFHGSATGLVAPDAAVAVGPTVNGNGYWIVERRGRVIGFGDAQRLGDVGGGRADPPIGDLDVFRP